MLMYIQRIGEYFDKVRKNLFYYAFFIFVIFYAVVFIFIWFQSKGGIDRDNARYLISAIIQSLAAIFTIIVTITLIAVQIASHSYSSRIIKIFTHEPMLWWSILFFSITILCSAFYLLFLPQYINYAPLSITGLLLCILYIAEYVRRLPEFLSLNNLLEKTFKEINFTYFEYLKENFDENRSKFYITDDQDKLMLFYDVMVNSIKRNDFSTARVSISMLREDLENKIRKGIINKNNEKIATKYYFGYLEKITLIALEREDYEVLDEISKFFEFLGIEACKAGLFVMLENIATTISSCEKINLEKGNHPNIYSVESLRNITSFLIDKNCDEKIIFEFVRGIFTICYDAGEKGYYHFIKDGEKSLKDIKEKLVKKDEEYQKTIKYISERLKEIKSFR